jgi:hypothetical protein
MEEMICAVELIRFQRDAALLLRFAYMNSAVGRKAQKQSMDPVSPEIKKSGLIRATYSIAGARQIFHKNFFFFHFLGKFSL